MASKRYAQRLDAKQKQLTEDHTKVTDSTGGAIVSYLFEQCGECACDGFADADRESLAMSRISKGTQDRIRAGLVRTQLESHFSPEGILKLRTTIEGAMK